MGNILRSLDKVGSEVEFNFGRNPRYQTICGGIVTLFAYSLIGFVMYTFFMKLFITKDPETTVSQSYTPTYPKIFLQENQIYPMFGLVRYGPSGEMIFVPQDEVGNYVIIMGVNFQINFDGLRNFQPE